MQGNQMCGNKPKHVLDSIMVSAHRIKWATNSFKPYKSPVPDVNYRVMLQMGPDIMVQKLCVNLLLGYIRKTWRLVTITFIPKPGKIRQDSAEALRPIRLISLILKIVEKLFDIYIREFALANIRLR